jgi:15-cis-phytoene synthase
VHTAGPLSFFWPQAFLGSHFAPAFFFLSRERRQALKILYAAFRLLDDTVDKPSGDPLPVLNAWRQFFETQDPRTLQEVGHESIGAALESVIKTYDIHKDSLLDFVTYGVESDLKTKRFETPMDTERYCYGVAGTVGVACLPIFGVPWQDAKEFAIRLGITIQWINVVRDVGVDADMGRIYLPQEHLEKYGVLEGDLLARRASTDFLKLMRYEGDVARGHYRRAMELMPKKWERELLPARIMGSIYMKLLAKIEKHNYPVLSKKVTLNIVEKGTATWNAVWS